MYASIDVPSSPSQPTYGLPSHMFPPIDRRDFSSARAAFLELISYRDVVAYLKWQFVMSEEIVALERTGAWDLVSLPLCVCPITCKGSTRLILALMVPLSVTKLVFVARGFQEEHGIDYNKTICSCEPYDH